MTPTDLFTARDHELIDMAINEKSFIPLLSHPKLMYHWQISHPSDLMTIAKIQGHRIGKHELCGDKCAEINKWLADQNTYTKSTDRKLFKNKKTIYDK